MLTADGIVLPAPVPDYLLERVVGEYGVIRTMGTTVMIFPDDELSARWIITTLDLIGFW